jgi:hypothetical protein
MKKGLLLTLFTILVAVVETKARLWSGYAPNLLLSGLIGLTGALSLTELLFYIFLGFLSLSGPVFSQELLVAIVVVGFIHFLRLFVFGQSILLVPLFSIVGILIFYLETIGFEVFTAPLFIFEICLVSLFMSLVASLILYYLQTSKE